MAMVMLTKGKLIGVVGLVLIGIVGAIIITTLGIGNAYKQGLTEVGQQTQDKEVVLRKRKNIQKITIRPTDGTGCYEVTADGIVQVYATCGGELSTASRFTDTKNILRLFKLLTEQENFSDVPTGGKALFTIVIETDQGTQTITLYENTELAQTITNIVVEIPAASSPSLQPIPSSQPNYSPALIFSPTPSAGSIPSPSPTIGGTTPEQLFTCNFAENFDKKPYRVSNIVCTDDPVPAP